MANLNSIPGIGKASLELLEAAGFTDTKSLAKARAGDLTSELERANQVLQIAKRAPVRANVEKWIASAREIQGISDDDPADTVADGDAPGPRAPVNHELNEQVMAMLADAPLAIPLPAKQLMENNLKVSEIPPAILLNRYSGDLEVRVDDRKRPQRTQAKPQVRAVGAAVQMAADVPQQRRDIDVSKIRSIEDLGPAPVKKPASRSRDEEDRISLIRTARESTNRGKNPSSRRFIRGVLHTHPGGLAIGAVVTLILMALLPLAVVSAALLLLSDLFTDQFYWVPKWVLAFPAALPVFGIAYLIWGLGGRCRICGQRLFFPKNCLKNSKAHHIPGMGHIVPLSVHLLLFRWFRCTYCGTPVRLKK